MNGFTKTVAIGALIVAGAARAGDKVKAIYSSSCYSSGDWLGKSANWDAEGTHPNAETDYVVDHGSAVRIGSNQAYTTFAGKSLRLGTAGGSDGAFILNTTCSSSYPFSVSGVGGLILERGYFRAWNTVSSLAEQTSREYLSGDIHVTSTATAPFRFMAERTNMTWGIRGTLLGGATACLKVEPYNDKNIKQTVELYGDCSQYLGELDVCDTIETTTLSLGGDFGGSLTVPSRGSLTFKDAGMTAVAIKGLTLAEGAEIVCSYANNTVNSLSVTDTLNFAGKVRIRLSNASALIPKKQIDSVVRWMVFSAPALSIKETDIDIVDADTLRAAGIHLEFAADVNGRSTLTFVRTPVAVLSAGTDSSGNPDCFTGAGNWSSGNPPDGDWTYYDNNKSLRTPSSFVDGAAGELAFAGGALIVANSLITQVRRLTIPKLTLLNGGGVYHWQSVKSTYSDATEYAPYGTKYLIGDCLYLDSGSETIGINSSELALLVLMPLAGSGNLIMKHSLASGLDSYIELLGDNSRWLGKQVSNVALGDDLRPAPRVTGGTGHLRINSGTSLGGELDEFAFDALSLSGGMVLWPYSGVTLSVATRGVLVSDVCAGIKVDADDVFTLNETVTLGANLHKLGEGRFVLGGGTMQFCTDAAPTPVAMPTDGCNDISVDAGSLEVTGVTAVDGASISFASGTKLVVRIPAADDMSDFSKYGFRNVKVDDPITFADAKLTIGFDASAVQPAECDIPLFTVSATAASTLDGKLMCAKPYGGHKVTAIVPRLNDDGSVTFVATVEQQGLMLLFR